MKANMKSRWRSRLMGALATTLCMAAPASGAAALDEITVAYFLQWPLPNLAFKAVGGFDNAMGVKLNWRSFGTGNEMTAAMASGDVQIAYAQGLTPFVVGVTKGAPLTLVSVAASYAENDNCIVHKDAGVTQANAEDLEGRQVASPIGNVTHYKMLRTLRHLGVDVGKINVLEMNPREGAAALARGEVAMACGFGGALQRMMKFGEPLMTAKEQEAIGIRVFDVVSVTNDFARDQPDLVVKFLQLTENANHAFRQDAEAVLPLIAKQAGQSLEDARSMAGWFEFPTRDEQLSEAWMGGAVERIVNEVANFYVKEGLLPKALDDYGPAIDDAFMRQVK